MRPALAPVLVLLAVLAGCSGDSGDRSYVIDEVRVGAELRPDGSLEVVEDRTFAFDGTYRFAFYELPLEDGQEVSGLSVAEEGEPLRAADVDDEAPGTFGLEDDDDGLAVRWFFTTPATDESRTFTLSYTVTGAAVRHADAAELYWQWIGTGWDVPTRELVADVYLPGELPLTAGEDLLLWGHGPLDGNVEQVGQRTVRTTARDVPPATFVELRALFPPGDLRGAPEDGRRVRGAIVAEEACLGVAADADRARARGVEPVQDCDPNAGRRRVVDIVLLGVGVAGLLGAGILFARHGRRPRLDPALPAQEAAPPSNDPPALVEWLLRWGNVGQGAVTATLLDLARRGAVEVEQVAGGDDVVFRVADRGVVRFPFEEAVLELVDRAGDGGEVTGSQLAAWTRTHRSEAGAWWSGFTTAISAEGRARGWLGSWWPFGIGLTLGFVVLGAAIAAAALGGSPVVLVFGFAVAVLTLGASALLVHRTPEGHTLATRWRRYRDFLRGAPLQGDLDPALVYALPLGVHKPLARAFAGADRAGLPLWYYPIVAGSGETDGIGVVAAAVSGSGLGASSSTGAGGGFSTGGGGGGGGSGGGAG